MAEAATAAVFRRMKLVLILLMNVWAPKPTTKMRCLNQEVAGHPLGSSAMWRQRWRPFQTVCWEDLLPGTRNGM